MKNQTLEYPNSRYYKTAKATVSCAHFKAGEFVNVEFYYTDDSGVDWFLINKTQNGDLSNTVAYPKTHLTEFCL